MTIQNEEIAEYLRKELVAWNSKDADSIAEIIAHIKCGFGWRAESHREHSNPTEEMKKRINKFLNTMERYQIDMDELHTWAEDTIGLAWGVWYERFKQKGQPSENARVRFSVTFQKNSDGWHIIMYHRDIQPFNEDGRYPIELTMVRE